MKSMAEKEKRLYDVLDGKKFREKFGRRKWYPKEADELGQESVYGILNPL